MVFFTKFFRPEPSVEQSDPIDNVERSGFVSVEKQIENMINAGLRLQLSRSSEFDYDVSDDLQPVGARGSELDQFDVINELTKIKPKTNVKNSSKEVKTFSPENDTNEELQKNEPTKK